MDERSVTLQMLDELQGLGVRPIIQNLPQTGAPASRVLFRIEEIGREVRISDAAGTPQRERLGRVQVNLPGRSHAGRSSPLTPIGNMLIGAHSSNHGLAYILSSSGEKISIGLGHFSAMEEQLSPLILRLLRSQFAPVRASKLDPPDLSGYARGGLLLGLPVAPEEDGEQHRRTIDMSISALLGERWCMLTLAQPLNLDTTRNLRARIIDETRRVEASTSAEGVSNPLAQRYLDLLSMQLDDLTLGQSIGLWRTATYLMGTAANFTELCSVWRGLLSRGGVSREPVRIVEDPRALSWASVWALPPVPSNSPLRPFDLQSVATSAQLAQIIDLPSVEVAGFGIRRQTSFDVVQTRRNAEEGLLAFGTIVRSGLTYGDYMLRPATLQRHAFVAGVTGAGKSNTMFHLLRQLYHQKIPFLVLEPTKGEYRALDLGGALRIYTVGDERTAPLRLNPFEVVGWPVNSVGVHIDLLRTCFAASSGMWTPLPQILEQCLYAIYRERGWDIATNTNSRMAAGDDPARAFPTLGDLVEMVDTYTSTLGYDDRVRADLRAALLTRLQALQVGGKGLMLETYRSHSMRELLEWPTILEMHNLGSDDDKALIMALLLIRLVEFRRAHGLGQAGLRHLLVIEEAHRLLANVQKSSQPEQADPKGQAVESFSNMISEIRAYGQGIAIVDQVPTKLAPDVIKNTNLKLAHRIVAEDDRSVIAGAMLMDASQKAGLASLAIGRAVVFEDGEDAPLLIEVPLVKEMIGSPPSDAAVREAMRNGADLVDALPFAACSGQCRTTPSACRKTAEVAKDVLIRRTFAKITLSMLADTTAVRRLWNDLEAVVEGRSPRMVRDEQAWTCLTFHLADELSQRWGQVSHWTHQETQKFADGLGPSVLRARKGQTDAALSNFIAEAKQQLRASALTCEACRECKKLWDDQEPCLPRPAVDDLIREGLFTAEFAEASRQESESPQQIAALLNGICNAAAYELIEFPDRSQGAAELEIGARARRTAICFGQQMLVRQNKRAPWIVSAQLQGILRSYMAEDSENDLAIAPHQEPL